MPSPIHRLRHLVILALLTTPASLAFQTQVFVDAVGGDDQHLGTSPADAFRTFTAATGSIPNTLTTGADAYEILAAPGLYDVALGESFPIVIGQNVTVKQLSTGNVVVLGSQIGARPTIDAGGAPLAMVMSGEDDLAPWKGSRNLVIRNADCGLMIEGLAPSFFGRRLGGFSFLDCGVGIEGDQSPLNGGAYIHMAACTFEGCRIGARLSGTAAYSLTSCVAADCSLAGIVADHAESLSMTSCRFFGCGTGVSLNAATGGVQNTHATLTHVLFANCRRGLLLGEGLPGRLNFSGARCTFADSHVGVQILPSPAGAPLSQADITESIFAQNGTDVVTGQSGLAISDSASFGNGGLSGTGIVVLDPEFRDPSAGDYRLRPSSPAIDVFPAQGSTFPPAFDGDQDLVLASDYGAFEFAPLDYRGEQPLSDVAPLGGTVHLTVSGEPGGMGIGMLQTAYSSGTTSTIFGDLSLSPALLVRAARLTMDPVTGFANWPLTLPSDPALAGVRWQLQALAPSLAAPAGAAFTNEMVIRAIP